MGEDPPFGVPAFVLTHHPRETLTKRVGTSFTFVTDGVGAAVEQARAAADGRDVAVAGGLAPLSSACGPDFSTRSRSTSCPRCSETASGWLLDDLDGVQVKLQVTRVVGSPAVTHLRYRVVE